MEPFELVKIKDNASGLGLFCLFGFFFECDTEEEVVIKVILNVTMHCTLLHAPSAFVTFLSPASQYSSHIPSAFGHLLVHVRNPSHLDHTRWNCR